MVIIKVGFICELVWRTDLLACYFSINKHILVHLFGIEKDYLSSPNKTGSLSASRYKWCLTNVNVFTDTVKFL